MLAGKSGCVLDGIFRIIHAGYLQVDFSQPGCIQSRPAVQIEYLITKAQSQGVHDPGHHALDSLWTMAGSVSVRIQVGSQHLFGDMGIGFNNVPRLGRRGQVWLLARTMS